MNENDWTQDADGRTNSSPLFEELVCQVERLIVNDAHYLIRGQAARTARLILAQLAHVHGLAPTVRPPSGPTEKAGERP